MSLEFINNWEAKLFAPERGEFMGGFTLYSIGAGLVLGIVGAILQLFMNMDTIDIVVSVLMLLYFGYMIKCMIPFVKSVEGTGKKVGYVAMALLLAWIAFAIGIYLAMLAIFGLIVYFVWKLFFSSGGSSRKKGSATVTYSDGTSEEVEEEGTGICGEKYYKTKDGRTIMKQ